MRLRIEKPLYGGAGLARAEDGKAVFVPFTLPGEFVTATVTEEKRSYAEARLDEVLEPAAERAAPPCPYFGTCGGCHYQHASYDAQLGMKKAVLLESLGRAGVDVPPQVEVHAAEPLGYRNRIRLHVRASNGALGYRERGSHRLLAVEVCPIAAPVLERALVAVGAVLGEQQLGPVFGEVELSTDERGVGVLMELWLRPGVPPGKARLEVLCAGVRARLPELRGAGVRAADVSESARPGRGGKQQPTPPRLLESSGEPWTEYRVGERRYRVSLGAFFQVHRGLVGELVSVACGKGRGALAWDLYAGVGLFSRVLAESFGRVVAVEGSPVSAGDLRRNLAAPHEAVESSTRGFLERERARKGAQVPQFVLLDPPRAGLGGEGARILSEIGPAAITYVSCDPTTLGRDLRVLLASGYLLSELHLFDLFPQTFHVEAVAKLRRG